MKKLTSKTIFIAFALAFLSLAVMTAGAAQAQQQGLIPPQTTNAAVNIAETHPAIKLTPDKSEIVNLDKAAASIIIGNPLHASVVMDTAQRLIVTPRTPGATHMTVLDSDGSIVMQRHILVVSPKEKYVRIRRSCGGAEGCEPTSVYYCPEGLCHQVLLNQGQQGGE